MGSESSAVRSCRLEEPPLTLPAGLSVYPAVLEGEKRASVFVYQRGNEDAVNKAAKHLKTLRHPCLLRFLSCTVEVDGIHLVTERVQPLEMVLDDVSADEMCAGIFDILQALLFLHDRGKLSHNNVCISSVFVSEDGHWKLGGMETMCQFSQATPEFLSSIKLLREQSGISPEEQSAGFQILPEEHGHARDAYSFGIMVGKLLPLLNDVVAEHLLADFQETLNVTLLNPNPTERPSLQSLLPHMFFRNDFLEVVNFLKSLTLKTEEEKNEFFKFLLDRLQTLPEDLMASRLVPQLLNPLVFAEPVAVKSFLPHLLQPKKDSSGDCQFSCLLSPDVFREHVSPVLLKLYSVREEHVRMVLLSHLNTYVDLFTLEDLQDIILPQVLLGLRDTNKALVSATLCGLAVLVPLLGADVVVGGERAKIFKRTTPNFTKSTEITPEGSPVHVGSGHESHSSLSPNKHLLKLFPKNSLPGKKPSDTREKYGAKYIQNQQPVGFETLTKTVVQCAEAMTSVSMNGFAGGVSVQSSAMTSVAGEEWPDWSESEQNEINTGLQPEHEGGRIIAHVQSEEAIANDEPWDDIEAKSDPKKIKAEQTISPQNPDLSIPRNKVQSKGMKLTWAPKSCSEVSYNSLRKDAWQQQNSTVGDSERTSPIAQKRAIKKVPLSQGLGEEFTISVKKKPERDPELDLFADMMPDIKLSSVGFLLPTQRTEPVDSAKVTESANPPLADAGGSQQFVLTSKFAAAADTTEAETEGWGDDLNWEDNTW
ncbi:protein-associating with the carboxyl-terminal domain of ezrin [Callorhinchus milii]|nr:protein-associating with the carboxyl-terminal domain of ezrin [Callorhinchus milii]|eukprot:gi/632955976/ref/XP_007893731.1/ PREDICTED: protein-associating with the carboxyl-terminal domain of ezrin [Callorhinchus milii]